MKAKKLLSILLAAMMVASFAACGNSESTSAQTQAPATQTEEKAEEAKEEKTEEKAEEKKEETSSVSNKTFEITDKGEHIDSFEASTSGQWDKMFAPVTIEGRAQEIGDLAPTAEEQAAMEKEPAYGKPIKFYLADGCTSGPTVANILGYYEEAGLTAEGFKGTSYTEALGTQQADVAVGHIATMLVPSTNGVDLTFVGGAHIGCKSLYVLADSEYNTTADLKGTSISVPNGIGASDYNITSLLLDADGINPQTDVNLMQVSTDACVASMENGEIFRCSAVRYLCIQHGKRRQAQMYPLSAGRGLRG